MLVLIHGDLIPQNIMVDEVSEDILVIVDWWLHIGSGYSFVMMSCRLTRQRIALEQAFDGAFEQNCFY